MPTLPETFEHILLRQTKRELLAFLLSLDKKDVVPIRQKLLVLKQELEEHKLREVAPGKFEHTALITPQQGEMLFWAGLAMHSRKEALGRGFNLWYLRQFELPADWTPAAERPPFLAILDRFRPDWLSEWLLRRTRANVWAAPQYSLIRELERRQLLPYDGWLTAQSVANLLAVYNWRRNDVPGNDIENYEQLILDDIRADEVLLTRDIPLLFDFDTMVDTASTFSGKERTHVTWLTVLPQLIASGHLNRHDVFSRCLLALRRSFRRPLLTWFKTLYSSLSPTPSERLAQQAELVELLTHPSALVVNFALDQLKDIWVEAAFDTELLLRSADSLLSRPDLKTGIKALLAGFGKTLKGKPQHARAVAHFYAGALAHSDAAVQERAAKNLAELLGSGKPVLTPAETAEATLTLTRYADLLSTTARTTLAPWLTELPPAAPVPEAVSYAPIAFFVPDLFPATALEPVTDWHELLFLTGQVLQHDDPLVLERWLDGLLRQQATFPADYPALLQPYVQQIIPFELEPGQSLADQWELPHVAGGLVVGHAGLARALVLSWATDFAIGFVSRVTPGQYAVSDPLVEVEQQRLQFVESLLRSRRALSLLSTPTHAPYWVAPTALMQKLLAYEAAHQEPNPTDVALALARVAYHAPAEAAAARQLLPQLNHAGLRSLLAWLLSPTEEPLPEAATTVAETTGSDSLEAALPWLWAVGARTRQPTAEFPALARLTPPECPNVARPWPMVWELVPKSYSSVQQWKPDKPTVTEKWVELSVHQQRTAYPPPNPALLYSLYPAFQPAKENKWQTILNFGANYSFLAALLPQYPAPLYWRTLHLAATRDTVDSTTREVLSQAMRTLLVPGPAFDEAATLLLAIGLTHTASVVRALALEALLLACDTGRLVPADLGQTLGKLLSAGFVPLPRLSDQLAQARAIAPATDDALRQLLEALLPALPTEPLRQTSKLLATYTDLLTRYPQPVPAAVQDRLREWASTPSLKKEVKELL
ncbi:DUF6493 family protein [Hymenobacter sp. J193]|uniref:DUF6493 family protein n=1 Tax=Hymenobacter sp. J193 TaxID=2898429 RepID=UPI002150975C|nr:DUF6493 family protein [Hymenobacter sp. J193]MCR5890930.1 DUF6493 family protein [Hymenobacter sp. J193]